MIGLHETEHMLLEESRQGSEIHAIGQDRAAFAFLTHLHEDEPNKHVLLITGKSGCGKSTFLRRLRESYCALMPSADWERLKQHAADAIWPHFQRPPAGVDVPAVFLDFAQQPRHEDRPTEPFFALLMLARMLAREEIHLPLFTFASLLILHQSGQMVPMHLRKLFGDQNYAFALSLAETISRISPLKLADEILSLFSRYLGGHFEAYMSARRLNRETIAALLRMPGHSALLHELPGLFAKDVNAALAMPGAPPRLVMLFDHPEMLRLNRNPELGPGLQPRDGWLNELLAQLSPQRIVVVVAAREAPGPLDNGQDWPMLAESITLPMPDTNAALRELQKHEIVDPEIQQQILKWAEVENQRVPPLFLHTCVYLLRSDAAKKKPLSMEEITLSMHRRDPHYDLFRQLFRMLDRDTAFGMIALSAARSFDAELYLHLSRRLYFNSMEKHFRRVLEFSFVVREEHTSGRISYRFDEQARIYIGRYGRSLVQRAHNVLFEFYKKRAAEGDETALAESIYHLNRISWEKGVLDWLQAFDAAIASRRWRLCRVLLAIAPWLDVHSHYWQGRLHQAEGDYHMALGAFKPAHAAYENALPAFERSLQTESEATDVLISRALTHEKLALLSAAHGRLQQVQASFQRAMQDYNEILKRDPNHLPAHSHLAGVHIRLGRFFTDQEQFDAAEEALARALEYGDALVRLAPGGNYARECKAEAHAEIARLQHRQLHSDAAITAFEQAIADYSIILQIDAAAFFSRINLARVREQFAQCLMLSEKIEPALEQFRQAVAELGLAAELQPDNVQNYLHKAKLQLQAARAHAEVADYALAQELIDQGRETCQVVLWAIPGHLGARHLMANALAMTAKMQWEMAQPNDAARTFAKARQAFEELTWRAPDAQNLRHDFSYLLILEGMYQQARAAHAAAEKSYARAIAILSGQHAAAPSAALNLCTALTAQAELQHLFGKDDEALENFHKARQLLQNGPLRAPDPSLAGISKIHTRVVFGHFLQESADYDGAVAEFQAAAKTGEQLRQVLPMQMRGMQLQSFAKASAAKLQDELGQYRVAQDSLSEAISIAHEAMQAFPGNLNVAFQSAYARYLQVSHQRQTAQYELAEENVRAALAVLASYSQAQQDEPEVKNLLGLLQIEHGRILEGRSQYEKAAACLDEAVSHFSALLERAPDDVVALNNKGIALLNLGRLQFWLSGDKTAKDAFRHAQHLFDHALRLAPKNKLLQINQLNALLYTGLLHFSISEKSEAEMIFKEAAVTVRTLAPKNAVDVSNLRSLVLIYLGNFYARYGNFKLAKGCATHAMSVLDKALQQAADNATLLCNRGIVLHHQGMLALGFSSQEDALEYYKRACGTFARLLEQGLQDVDVLYYMGMAKIRLGYIYSNLAQFKLALEHFEQSTVAFERLLSIAPERVEAYLRIGDAFFGSALILQDINEPAQALESLTRAQKAYEEVIRRIPNDAQALLNLGEALLQIGDLESRAGETTQALWNYKKAIDHFGAVIDIDANRVSAFKRKGDALLSMADLQCASAQYKDAQDNYKGALAAYDQALKIAADDIESLYSRAVALANLGGVEMQLARLDEAMRSYKSAIVSYNEVIRKSPGYGNIYYNLGLSYVNVGSLYAEQEKYVEALKSFREAVAVQDKKVEEESTHLPAYSAKGNALLKTGDLLAKLVRYKEASERYAAALQTYEKALEIAPDDMALLFDLGLVLSSLAGTHIKLGDFEAGNRHYERASQTYDRILQLQPENANALYSKGLVYLQLAEAATSLNGGEGVIRYYEQADKLLMQAFQISPQDVQIRAALRNAHTTLETLQAGEGTGKRRKKRKS